MNSNKILEISLIKKPDFRLDLSNIKWDIFFQTILSKKKFDITVLDGSRKKPFEEFFSTFYYLSLRPKVNFSSAFACTRRLHYF